MRMARVMPGQAKAARPNRTAQTPLSTTAHQLRARVASMMASLPRSHVHCESQATETPGTGTPYAFHRASSRVEEWLTATRATRTMSFAERTSARRSEAGVQG